MWRNTWGRRSASCGRKERRTGREREEGRNPFRVKSWDEASGAKQAEDKGGTGGGRRKDGDWFGRTSRLRGGSQPCRGNRPSDLTFLTYGTIVFSCCLDASRRGKPQVSPEIWWQKPVNKCWICIIFFKPLSFHAALHFIASSRDREALHLLESTKETV